MVVTIAEPVPLLTHSRAATRLAGSDTVMAQAKRTSQTRPDIPTRH